MWTWTQSHGILTAQNGDMFKGYSGADWGKNNPQAQAAPNIGPIPCGLWAIGKPYDSPNTGPYTLPLTPAPETDTLGRSAFRIHGDSVAHPGTASHGCVVLSRGVRERIWNSNDHELTVKP